MPWVCWDIFEVIAWYFLAVETKGLTRRFHYKNDTAADT